VHTNRKTRTKSHPPLLSLLTSPADPPIATHVLLQQFASSVRKHM
jgi:hypothetical protein